MLQVDLLKKHVDRLQLMKIQPINSNTIRNHVCKQNEIGYWRKKAN